jgi:hypothetical protein
MHVPSTIKQGQATLSYKLGGLKAVKEFSKQANIPTSAALKLVPQLLNL